jgi:hypothetical protein
VEWSSVAAGLVVGVGVGFLASYPVGFFREVGRDQAARLIRRRNDVREQRRAEEASNALIAEREATTAREVRELEVLSQDRVGALFLHRVHRDDVGIQVTVVELDARQPRQRVIVRYEPTTGRTPTPHDPPVDQRVSIEWRALTATDADQRHRTALLIEKSYDDADGWIEYERIWPQA